MDMFVPGYGFGDAYSYIGIYVCVLNAFVSHVPI